MSENKIDNKTIKSNNDNLDILKTINDMECDSLDSYRKNDLDYIRKNGNKTYSSWFNKFFEKRQKLTFVKILLISGICFVFISFIGHLLQYLLITTKFSNSVILIPVIILGFIISFVLWLLWHFLIKSKHIYLWGILIAISFCVSIGSSFSFIFYLTDKIEATIIFSIIGLSYITASFLILLLHKNNIKLNFIILYVFIGVLIITTILLIIGFTTNISLSFFGIKTKNSNYGWTIFSGVLISLIYLIIQITFVNSYEEFEKNKLTNKFDFFLGIKSLGDLFFIILGLSFLSLNLYAR